MNENNLQPATHKPFAGTLQHLEWIRQNCDCCKVGFDNKAQRFRCKFEFALCLALVDKNGKIPAVVAKAIGALEYEGGDLWECLGWVRR